MTIREMAQKLVDGHSTSMAAHHIGLNILNELDRSREVTEKVTHVSHGWQSEQGSLADRISVTAHKARVVLDD